MVGKKTKSITGRTLSKGKVLVPLFKGDNVSDFTDEILKEDRELRRYVQGNPRYRRLLEQQVTRTFKDYKWVLRGARLVDTWDRVTSTVGLAADAVGPVSGGLGNLISALEEVPELVPKLIYAIYYRNKTGDSKALRYWTAAEAASFIPVLGDAIDMTNIYIDKARKATKEKVKKEMRKQISSGLESRARKAA